MKKLILVLIAVAGFTAAITAQTVLSTASQATTVTTQVVIEEGRWKKQADGSVKLTVPLITIKRDGDGKDISKEYTGESLEVVLSPSQFSGISALLKAAYEAKISAQSGTP